jgi:hypothetical protein
MFPLVVEGGGLTRVGNEIVITKTHINSQEGGEFLIDKSKVTLSTFNSKSS